MKIVVTIPTYNEAENIGSMMEQLTEVFKTMLRHDFFILVVDGNSPDGTGDIVEKYSKKHDNVKLLLEEEKNGLGAAYLFAFNYAMNMMDADVVIEMDADFQHDPKDVPRLVAEIDKGADYVIGSRFTEGGSIPKEWGLHRKILSRGGSLFCKYVLWIHDINDFTSGFKASKVKGFLNKIDLNEVQSKGFSYKIDILYKMHKLGAKMVEVPIQFGLRDRGDSKMAMKTLFESFYLVLKLRATELQSFLLFLVVGTIGLFTDLFIFNIIIFLNDMNVVSVGNESFPAGAVASLISGFIAMFVTFVLNNLWTFRDRKINSIQQIAISLLVYYLSSYIPIILRSWLVKYMVANFGDTFLINNIALFIGIIFGVIWNFTVYSQFIWKKQNKEIEG